MKESVIITINRKSKIVKHILPDELAEMIKLNGSNTDTRFLFDEDINRLSSVPELSEMYAGMCFLSNKQ